jgi:uncharacterized protein (TIGR02466 family)
MNITNVDSDTTICNPFPSFIYRTKLNIDLEELTNKIELLVDRGNDWSLFSSHFTHRSLENIDPIFAEVSRQITAHANRFYCLSKNVKLVNLMDTKRIWFNVYRQGGYMRPHDHYEVYYGSSFYVKTNKTSRILFTHPSQIKFNTVYEVDPQPGELLIWPGWLLHEVSPNLELGDERIVVSAKIDYKSSHFDLDNRRVDQDIFDDR